MRSEESQSSFSWGLKIEELRTKISLEAQGERHRFASTGCGNSGCSSTLRRTEGWPPRSGGYP